MGNALSQIALDVYYKYYLWKAQNPEDIFYMTAAWNSHGLPYEKIYLEDVGTDPSYEDILKVAQKYISIAQEEENCFVDYNLKPKKNYIEYYDTDEEYIEYCKDKIQYLYREGFIKRKGEQLFLRLDKAIDLKSDLFINDIEFFPKHHKNSVLNILNTLNADYPLSKERKFTFKIEIEGSVYSINPIFQSILIPVFIREKYDMENLLEITGKGLVKGHYLMCAISTILNFKPPYKKVYMHGTVLGDDRKRMSKHSENVIRPSDLKGSRNFVRYVLLRTFSEKDKLVQLKKGRNEYRKIESKLDIILKYDFEIQDIDRTYLEKEMTRIYANLENFKLENAIEIFYSFMKRVRIKETSNKIVDKEAKALKDLCRIFFIG